MNGVDYEYFFTPSTSDLNIVGDIDLRARISVPSWTPTGLTYIPLLGKYFSAQYLLTVQSGSLWIYWFPSATGLSAAATVTLTAAGVPLNTPVWLRATLQVNNGAAGYTVKFYWSTDNATWTQIGANVTVAGITSIRTTTDNLEAGSMLAGSYKMVGTLFETEVRNGINGTLVSRLDARQLSYARTYREGPGTGSRYWATTAPKEIGWAATTATQSIANAATDVTGLSMSFTVLPGHIVFVEVQMVSLSLNVAATAYLYITDNAGTITRQTFHATAQAGGTFNMLLAERITTPGVYTRKVRMLAGSGTLTTNAVGPVASIESFIRATH